MRYALAVSLLLLVAPLARAAELTFLEKLFGDASEPLRW
jgi:hypothetical protein